MSIWVANSLMLDSNSLAYYFLVVEVARQNVISVTPTNITYKYKVYNAV